MKRVVLAVDPGKVSGVALFEYDRDAGEPTLVSSGEHSFDDFQEPIMSALMYAMREGVTLEVVCERFTINAQTIKNSQAPFSLEKIGVLKYLMMTGGLDYNKLAMQSPSDAKRMFDNNALKKLEYWHRGGAGHALDAIRHGLLYLAKTGWSPRRLLQ